MNAAGLSHSTSLEHLTELVEAIYAHPKERFYEGFGTRVINALEAARDHIEKERKWRETSWSGSLKG